MTGLDVALHLSAAQVFGKGYDRGCAVIPWCNALMAAHNDGIDVTDPVLRIVDCLYKTGSTPDRPQSARILSRLIWLFIALRDERPELVGYLDRKNMVMIGENE